MVLETEICRFEKSLMSICARVVLPPPDGAEKMINFGLSGAGAPKMLAHSVALALGVNADRPETIVANTKSTLKRADFLNKAVLIL